VPVFLKHSVVNDESLVYKSDPSIQNANIYTVNFGNNFLLLQYCTLLNISEFCTDTTFSRFLFTL